jgi:predicted nucleic acid-binding Zn finger protein
MFADDRNRTAVKSGPKDAEFAALYLKARQAGLDAGSAEKTSTMVVVGHGQRYVVPEGPCGFAWVVVKPGTSAFARWLVKKGYASKHYYGGVSIWVSDFNQSMERKYAYAAAFAEVLRQGGIENCYADSRMD